MKTLSAFIISISVVSALAVSASAQTITPGQWSAVTKFKIFGVPIPDSTGESCVTADDAKDVRATLASQISKIGCTITQWSVNGNTVQAALTCDNANVKASGKLNGTFTPKSYHLKGTAHGFYKDSIPAVASVDLTGQWVSPCPPPTSSPAPAD